MMNNVYDKERTLFVSDLDGTLMGSDGKLKKETANAVNLMVKEGIKFTIATARSYTSAMWVASVLKLDIPMILHNGVFIRDKEKGVIRSHLLPEREKIRRVLAEYGLEPFVYSLRAGEEKYSYIPERLTKEAMAYQTKRGVNDPRDNPIPNESTMWDGEVYHVLVIDNSEKMWEVKKRLQDDYNCLCGKDYYSGDLWLEIFPKSAGKASAIMELRALLGCDRVVVFGDGENDISMFEAADEAYAVSGAVESLKSRATGIIGSCDEGAVVKWLAEQRIK